jgi:hypothetical protein
MGEKFLSATGDYLKFTFGAMLLATAGFFLYAYFVAGGAAHREQFETVKYTIEITVLLVFSTKILTGVFSSRERIVERFRDLAGVESLSVVERTILSVASVFLSIHVLVMLLATMAEHHRGGVGFKKRG